MRKNIEKVLNAFVDHRSAIGDSKRTCSTDGETIWSYKMPLAKRGFDDTIYLVKYDSGPSRTTKSQIRAIDFYFSYTLKYKGFEVKRVDKIPE